MKAAQFKSTTFAPNRVNFCLTRKKIFKYLKIWKNRLGNLKMKMWESEEKTLESQIWK